MFGLQFRDIAPQWFVDELDQLILAIKAFLLEDYGGEHTETGGHADITAKSVTVSEGDDATGEVHADGDAHSFGEVKIEDDLEDVAGIADATGVQFDDSSSGWATFSTPARSPFDTSNSQREYDILNFRYPNFPVVRLGPISGVYAFLPHEGQALTLGYKDGTSVNRIKYLAVQDGIYEQGRNFFAGQFVDLAVTDVTFGGNGAATWTVQSGDKQTLGYTIIGNTMFVWFELSNTSVARSGGDPIDLHFSVPGGHTIARDCRNQCRAFDNGVQVVEPFVFANSATNLIEIHRGDLAQWADSVNNTIVSGQVAFPISN